MCHGDPPRPFRLSCLRFPTYAYDSSPVMSTCLLSQTSLRPCVSRMIRLSPVPVLLAPSLLSDFLPLPDWTLFLLCTLSVLTPVCTCIIPTCIYTGLEMGRSPSSIYFATTLKVRLVRSHELSSSSLVCWPRLFAPRLLGSSPLFCHLPVVKSSLRSVLRCARNRRQKIEDQPRP